MHPNNYNSPPAVADPLLPYTAAVNTYLGLGRSTADKLLKNGDIAAIRIGGRWMVRLSAVTDFIAAAESRTIADRRRRAA